MSLPDWREAGLLEAPAAPGPLEKEPHRPRAESPLLEVEALLSFFAGTDLRAYERFGAHLVTREGRQGVRFLVWAPNALTVSVIGPFNAWEPGRHTLENLHGTGAWGGFVPGIAEGERYKYHIISRYHHYTVEKADPFGFAHETPPQTASVVRKLDYAWNDAAWLSERRQRNALEAPVAIYEVHLGSWRRVVEHEGRWLSYREAAPRLAAYVREMGFTHIEFLPLMEHPFYGSWGYQATGFFAPTSRYGPPEDFMYLVDHLHQNGIGVILDWVPAHFPTDVHGLSLFDGTHLFEHADPRQGFHPDWKTAIFNYGRNEVRSFLLSSALFWLEKYHVDGLRLDAVASMLYLDYSRKPGEWVPNRHGGRENLDAIEFLRMLNTEVYRRFPDVMTIAEESTAWPKATYPVHGGGLGFGLKWDMGWMHDSLRYLKRPPPDRKLHHGELQFRMVYAFNENYVLPLSHDEVVHGQGSLFSRMPGDEWQRFANLRLLFGYLYAEPGKKLLFMGDEWGQWAEWNHESSLDWHVLADRFHEGVRKWVADLNHLYRAHPALHQHDCRQEGFQWVDHRDTKNTTLSFLRQGKNSHDLILAVFNFTPAVRHHYRVGVPRGGSWRERLNSDAAIYGGSGQGNRGEVHAEPNSFHGRPWSLSLTLPPLAALIFSTA